MSIQDKRAEYQEDAITRLVAYWAEQRQIPDYNTYVAALRKWNTFISDGKPLLLDSSVSEEDRTELNSLIEFLSGILIDVETQEKTSSDVREALILAQAEFKTKLASWNSTINSISALRDQNRKQHSTRYGVSTTEPFTKSTLGEYDNVQVNELCGCLELAPLHKFLISSNPTKVSLEIHPPDNLTGGVVHKPSKATDVNITKYLSRGLNKVVHADTTPLVRVGNVDWPGVVGEITLIYRSPVVFNAMEIPVSNTYPLDLIRLQVATSSDNSGDIDTWTDVLLDNIKIIKTTSNSIVIRNINSTACLGIKIWLCQSHKVTKNSPPIVPSYSEMLSDAEGQKIATPSIPPHQYSINTGAIKLYHLSYEPVTVGEYRSHSSGGFTLGNSPIATVELEAKYDNDVPGSIQWNLDLTDQNVSIPILPRGTGAITEPAIFKSGILEIWTTFPIQEDTLVKLSINGIPQDSKYITIASSRRINVSPDLRIRIGDYAVIEYTPARESSVIVYVIRNENNRDYTLSTLGQSILTTVFPNRREIDKVIELDGISDMESKATLARLDEFDYWFLSGWRENNMGRTFIPIPPILE
jgi:hypothetical protein